MIGILACSKTKAASPCRAVDLYQGRTFWAARDVLTRRGCARFVVLSALYGAVEGERVIAPYEQTLLSAPLAERRAWARMARAQLVEIAGDEPLVAIVPAAYAPALEGLRVERLYAGCLRGGCSRRSRRSCGREPPQSHDRTTARSPYPRDTTLAGVPHARGVAPPVVGEAHMILRSRAARLLGRWWRALRDMDACHPRARFDSSRLHQTSERPTDRRATPLRVQPSASRGPGKGLLT